MTKITLVLAMAPGKPDGDVDDRLMLNLTLTGQGQIDTAAYETADSPWLATRERPDAPPRELEVIRLDEGWALQSTNSLDDPIWVFEGQIYRPGELVQLRRPNGEHLLFRIVATETPP
jgi:hypothetical protein